MFEKEKIQHGYGGKAHIGIDEAGRGCLAGPVVASAIFAPDGFVFSETLHGLGDSKAMSEEKREILARAIMRSELVWGIGLSWPCEIDKVNILCATFRAMSRAVLALNIKTGFKDVLPPLLIDGNQIIPVPQWRAAISIFNDHSTPDKLKDQGSAGFAVKTGIPEPSWQKAIIKGDSLIPAISAASIIAKTYRDRLMCAEALRFPDYGFEKHKGYGTEEHLKAIQKSGPVSLHRRTFKGVRREEEQCSMLPGTCLSEKPIFKGKRKSSGKQ